MDAPLQPDGFWKERQLIRRVRIPLSQHIGMPALPCVEKGQQVKAGECIAEPAMGLSVGIHASLDGIVREVNDSYIAIS